MPLTARGNLYLAGQQFTSDPDVYEREWPKRMSEHPVLGGSVIIQDYGRFAKDLTLTLQSGEGQFLEKSLVDTLDGMAATKGATYALVDWEGTEATVFIANFDPQPTRLGSLYRYTMTLRVRAITKLRGVAYGGA